MKQGKQNARNPLNKPNQQEKNFHYIFTIRWEKVVFYRIITESR